MFAIPEGPANIGALARNSRSSLVTANELLTRIVGNILANPLDPKYRTIKITNAKFAKDVWALEGASDFLKSMGFKQDGEVITFPEGTPFAPLTASLAQLQALCTCMEQQEQWPAGPLQSPMLAEAPSSSTSTAGQAAPVDAQQVILEEIRREKRKRMGKDLSANSAEVLEDTLHSLLLIYRNALEHPGDPKYTRIRTTNAQFRRTVFDVPGGEHFMLASGFRNEEVDGVEFLVLPPDADMEALRRKLEELEMMQEKNNGFLEEQRERLQAESREAMRKLKASMMQQLKAAMNAPSGSTSSSSNANAGTSVHGTGAAEGGVQLASRKQLLRRLMSGADTEQARENELEWKALQLIEDISVLMEFHARLSGENTYVATWKIEKRRLYDKFKSDRDIGYLHDIMEEWEEKVQQLKRKTGKVFVDIEAPQTNVPQEQTGMDVDAAVEERYRQLGKR